MSIYSSLDQILPHVEELYKKYHARGFEIVDLCVDKNLTDEDWKVRTRQLPWDHHLSERLTVEAGLPSVDEYYDNQGGNHLFFVSPEGKVLVSKWTDTFDADEIGMSPGDAMKNWSDRFYTIEVEKALNEVFP